MSGKNKGSDNNKVVVWPESKEVHEGPVPQQDGFNFEQYQESQFEEDLEDLYSAEICDWWDPFNEHYPASRNNNTKEEINPESKLDKKLSPKQSRLSVKLMDVLNEDLVAKLQTIA